MQNPFASPPSNRAGRRSATAPTVAARTWQPGDPAARQILIIDGEPHTLQLMRRSLQAAGYEIHAARTADEAARRIDAVLPDVLIADARLAGFDEQMICEQVARRYSCRIGLFVLLNAGPRSKRLCGRRWCPDAIYYEKPVSQRRLVEHLDSHFAAVERHG